MACGCTGSNGLGIVAPSINLKGYRECPCPPGHPLYPKNSVLCCQFADQAAAEGGSSTIYYAIAIAAVAGIAYFGYKALK